MGGIVREKQPEPEESKTTQEMFKDVHTELNEIRSMQEKILKTLNGILEYMSSQDSEKTKTPQQAGD